MNRIRSDVIGLLFLSVFSCPAQSIINLKVSPGNPNSAQNLLAIATEQFPSSGCPRSSWIVNATTNTIQVYSYHNMGMLTAICNTTDTIPFGPLPAGSYTLIFNLLNDQNAQVWDSDTISFVVTGTVGKEEFQKQKLSIYPNPSSTGVFVVNSETEWQNLHPALYTVLGEKLNADRAFETNQRIDLSTEPEGIYVLEYGAGNKRQRIRLINLNRDK